MVNYHLRLLEELIEKATTILRWVVEGVSHEDVFDQGLQVIYNPVRVVGNGLTVHEEIVNLLRTFSTNNISLSLP